MQPSEEEIIAWGSEIAARNEQTRIAEKKVHLYLLNQASGGKELVMEYTDTSVYK